MNENYNNTGKEMNGCAGEKQQLKELVKVHNKWLKTLITSG